MRSELSLSCLYITPGLPTLMLIHSGVSCFLWECISLLLEKGVVEIIITIAWMFSYFTLSKNVSFSMHELMTFYLAVITNPYQRLKLISKYKIFRYLHSSNFIINHRRNSFLHCYNISLKLHWYVQCNIVSTPGPSILLDLAIFHAQLYRII